MKFLPSLLPWMILLTTTSAGFAGEIHKWTDANGKVHFADAEAAPQESQPVSLPVGNQYKASSYKPVPATSTHQNSNAMETMHQRMRTAQQQSPLGAEVDESKLDPRCRELAAQIADTPSGNPFKHLSDELASLCPAIGYECRKFRSHPERNYCQARQRLGDAPIVQSTTYN